MPKRQSRTTKILRAEVKIYQLEVEGPGPFKTLNEISKPKVFNTAKCKL